MTDDDEDDDVHTDDPIQRGSSWCGTRNLSGCGCRHPGRSSAIADSKRRCGPSARGGGVRDYRLTPGDKLRVEVYKDAQLSQSLQIRPDGKVTLPLLGDIVATDLTPIQLRDRIATGLKEYITNPVVTVIVVEASPVMVYVMGEVTQPGSIPMRGPDDRSAGAGDGRRLPRVREHEGHPHPAQAGRAC